MSINGTGPSAPVSGVCGSTSTIGRRRRAAAIASPSRVWAFSRTRSRSSSVWNAARSATGGRAASRTADTLGSVGWSVTVKSLLVTRSCRRRPAPRSGAMGLRRRHTTPGSKARAPQRAAAAPRPLAPRKGASCLVRRLRASCCFRQGLELGKQDLHPFAHLYLGQQDTYGAVRVDEEVGAQSAGPPVAAGPPALAVDTDAEAPAGSVPKAREEAVRRLGDNRHLVAGHQPEVLL